MPVISTLWESEVGGSPEVRSLRPAWPTWQNPISTKNTKIRRAVVMCTRSPCYSGGRGRMAWNWEAEVAVSRDRATAPQPGWQTKNLKKIIKWKIEWIFKISKSYSVLLYNRRNWIAEGCHLPWVISLTDPWLEKSTYLLGQPYLPSFCSDTQSRSISWPLDPETKPSKH